MAAAGAAVTTIEIDPDLAAHARTALAGAGYADVDVVFGDGERGVPEHAYDRVIATASVRAIPYAWVSQTADGGRIVVPYSGQHHPSGLAVLTVSAGAAAGRIIHDQAWFMPMRGHRPSQDQLSQIPRPHVYIRVGPEGQHITAGD